jgi:hypothetical protein
MVIGAGVHCGTNERVGVYVATRVFNTPIQFEYYLLDDYESAVIFIVSQTNDE